jgi:hypothetical protein
LRANISFRSSRDSSEAGRRVSMGDVLPSDGEG